MTKLTLTVDGNDWHFDQEALNLKVIKPESGWVLTTERFKTPADYHQFIADTYKLIGILG